jgi:hypothetical protein
MAFEEFEARGSVKILGSVSVLGVWADESKVDDNTCQVEELGDFSDTAGVLGTIFRGEGEAFVETSTNKMTLDRFNMTYGTTKVRNSVTRELF